MTANSPAITSPRRKAREAMAETSAMPARALTAEDVAAEFGRSKAWIYDNWKRLAEEGAIPAPLIEAGHLVWSAAQFYAHLDRKLPPKLQALAAAHRACMSAAPAAIAGHAAGDDAERWRAQLTRRFAGQS